MQRLLLWGGIGFAILVVVIVAVTTLSRGRNTTTNPNQPTGDQTTLTLWDPIDEPSVFKEIIERYQEQNPDVKIKFVKKPLQDYETESTNALLASVGPDIWALPNTSILRHTDQLAPAPDDLLRVDKKDKKTISQVVKDKFVPIVAEENIKDNKLYGLPLYVDTLTLFTNPSLLRERVRQYQLDEKAIDEDLFIEGPKNWNEFIELVKLYTVKGPNNEISRPAVALGRTENIRHAQDILALLMLQNGATIASPDGLTATFNLPSSKQTTTKYYPGTAALEFFTAFSDPANPLYTWDNSQPNSYEAFRDGKVAMIIDYSKTANELDQDNPNLSYKQLSMPQIAGAKKAIDLAEYWSLTVPKTSKNPALAWDFIRFFQSIGSADYLAQTNRPAAFIPQIQPQTLLERTELNNPGSFQSQTAVGWYKGKDPQKIDQAFLEMINQVVGKKASSQNAINDAARKVSEIFRTREGFVTTPAPTPQKED